MWKEKCEAESRRVVKLVPKPSIPVLILHNINATFQYTQTPPKIASDLKFSSFLTGRLLHEWYVSIMF